MIELSETLFLCFGIAFLVVTFVGAAVELIAVNFWGDGKKK